MPFQRELRDLAYVPRWSIVRVAKPQSVAEHSYYTTVYALQLARLIRWEADWTGLLELALWHDVEECFTGDMPGPVKHRLFDDRAAATVATMMTNRFGGEWISMGICYTPQGFKEARQIIRVASLIDDILFLAGELQRGNEACRAAEEEVFNRLQIEWKNLPGWVPEPGPFPDAWNLLMAARYHELNGQSMEPNR